MSNESLDTIRKTAKAAAYKHVGHNGLLAADMIVDAIADAVTAAIKAYDLQRQDS